MTDCANWTENEIQDLILLEGCDYDRQEAQTIGEILALPERVCRYVEEPIVCPFCGYDNIRMGKIQSDNHVWQRNECTQCEAEWDDVYTLSTILVRAYPNPEFVESIETVFGKE
jgi:hypothetical protein